MKTVVTVVGPRGGKIHYAESLSGPSQCKRSAPRQGWTKTNDSENNKNTDGFCERCMRVYATVF